MRRPGAYLPAEALLGDIFPPVPILGLPLDLSEGGRLSTTCWTAVQSNRALDAEGQFQDGFGPGFGPGLVADFYWISAELQCFCQQVPRLV